LLFKRFACKEISVKKKSSKMMLIIIFAAIFLAFFVFDLNQYLTLAMLKEKQADLLQLNADN